MSTRLERFEKIRSASACTFAASSRLIRLPEWRAEASIEENLKGHIAALESLCSSAGGPRIDGIVLEAPGVFGKSVDDLADLVGEVVRTIVANDPAGGKCLDEPIEQPGWWLTFAGMELFVLAFAPCYPRSHPRWSEGADSVFLLIQPRSAFARRRRAGRDTLGQGVRRSIRRRFADRGMDYDVTLAESPIEAHQFVKPIAVGDPPVRWWESRQERTGAVA
jgi:YqcI/YcgG family